MRVGRIPVKTTSPPQLLRGLPGLSEQLAELPLHVAETGAAEDVGIEIELEVEAGELGGEVGIVQRPRAPRWRSAPDASR